MNSADKAKNLLFHYFNRVDNALDVDALDEIESIVDLIIDAAVKKVELRKLDRLIAEEMEDDAT